MNTLTKQKCSTLAGLCYARETDNLGMIDFFVKSALSAVELNTAAHTFDQKLIDELFLVADWYAGHSYFDRAETIYLLVLDAQEMHWGTDCYESSKTMERLVDLILREEYERERERDRANGGAGGSELTDRSAPAGYEQSQSRVTPVEPYVVMVASTR